MIASRKASPQDNDLPDFPNLSCLLGCLDRPFSGRCFMHTEDHDGSMVYGRACWDYLLGSLQQVYLCP